MRCERRSITSFLKRIRSTGQRPRSSTSPAVRIWSLSEIEDALGIIESEADDQADIIWGSVIKEDMDDEIRITVIATGFDTAASVAAPKPRIAEPVQAVAARQDASTRPVHS